MHVWALEHQEHKNAFRCSAVVKIFKNWEKEMLFPQRMFIFNQWFMSVQFKSVKALSKTLEVWTLDSEVLVFISLMSICRSEKGSPRVLHSGLMSLLEQFIELAARDTKISDLLIQAVEILPPKSEIWWEVKVQILTLLTAASCCYWFIRWIQLRL